MSSVDVDVIGRCGGMDGYGEMYGCWMMDRCCMMDGCWMMDRCGCMGRWMMGVDVGGWMDVDVW